MNIRNAVIKLLETDVGFEIDLFAMLNIHQLEDGRWRIFNNDIGDDKYPTPYDTEDDSFGYDEDDDSCEEIYEDLETAVDRFLELREERRLGYDFERG